MRIIALFLIAFCACACWEKKEEALEKETWFELKKLGLDKIKLDDGREQ
jgi:hypothetical protein